MDTKQIEYILAIAREKNMTRAAQTLYISQPTLSQALAKLEQEIGQPLFQREHSEMLPTQAGLDYIYTAKQVLELKHRLYQKIQINSSQRHLEIGVSSHWAASMITRVIVDMKHQNIPYFSLHIIDESPINLLKKVWTNSWIYLSSQHSIQDSIRAQRFYIGKRFFWPFQTAYYRKQL